MYDPTYHDEPCNAIIDRKLYLGNRHAASSRQLLQRLGVTHVVNAAEEQPNFFPNELRYYNCNLKDNLTERIDFEGPLWFIRQAHSQNGVVLVHCAAGISRSASIVIAYLMKDNGMSMADALRRVQQCRPIVDPNENYVAQLSQMDSVRRPMLMGSIPRQPMPVDPASRMTPMSSMPQTVPMQYDQFNGMSMAAGMPSQLTPQRRPMASPYSNYSPSVTGMQMGFMQYGLGGPRWGGGFGMPYASSGVLVAA